MNHTALTMLAALACFLIPIHADAAPELENDVQLQVDRLSFLIGNWDCTGRVFTHGKATAHPTVGHVHAAKVVDGHWILFSYDEDKTTENPRPFHIDQYFGYDPGTKTFVSVALDVGGYFSETTSEFAGDSISFDQVADGKVIGHDIFTRRTQDEISHTGKDLDKKGRWVESDEEICHRTR